MDDTVHYSFHSFLKQCCQILRKVLPNIVKSGLLYTFSSTLASVAIHKVKSYYNIQCKCIGNYNLVALGKRGVCSMYFIDTANTITLFKGHECSCPTVLLRSGINYKTNLTS